MKVLFTVIPELRRYCMTRLLISDGVSGLHQNVYDSPSQAVPYQRLSPTLFVTVPLLPTHMVLLHILLDHIRLVLNEQCDNVLGALMAAHEGVPH